MNSQKTPGQELRRVPSVLASVVLIAVGLVGCASEPQDPSEPDEEPMLLTPGDNSEDDGSSLEEPDDHPSETAAQAVGSITLSWTGGTEHQNFEYVAEHCYVGADYILVEGSGGPVGGAGESQIKIFTTPEELLHEGTGTFQAAGAVQFTWGGTEIIADGRQIHVGDYPQPAVFTYRHDDSSVKYVVAWFDGADDSGAGAVEVECNY
ncbi:MAG: hypothetical protein Q4G35_01540 [Propionibacteriaceae bacterium]|nr:hypothetical protein [Propionibacteriaceae bacterium]